MDSKNPIAVATTPATIQSPIPKQPHKSPRRVSEEIIPPRMWRASVPKSLKPQEPFFTDKVCCMIGAPLAAGQGLRGVDRAPEVLRESGIAAVVESMGWKFEDRGDCVLPPGARYQAAEPISPEGRKGDPTELNASVSTQAGSPGFGQNEEFYTDALIKNSAYLGAANKVIYDAVRDVAKDRKFVLTVGGDHGIASATIGGMLSVHPDLAVIWIDAHSDCNTPESSPSGNYHGMPAAHIMGWFQKKAVGFEWLENPEQPFLPEKRLCFIGLRDVDEQERNMLLDSSVGTFGMQHVDRMGIHQVVKEALDWVDPEGCRPIHISLDIDGCDPLVAPGTGTRARGGLSYREIHYLCEYLRATQRVVSMDLVEINPDLDLADEGLHGDQLPISLAATKTVRLGLELIGSAVCGKVIL